MRAPDRQGVRLLRSLVLTAAGTGLGALAHTQAADTEVGPGSVLAVLAVLGLSWVATARRVAWPVIALVLAAGQVLTHLALSAGHAGITHRHGSGAAAVPAVEAMDGRMALLHLGTWVALTWVFTVGERALWRSVRHLVSPWSRPRLPYAVPGQLLVTPSPGSTLAHTRTRGRAPPRR